MAVRIQDGSGNSITSTGNALDINIKSTSTGTAPLGTVIIGPGSATIGSVSGAAATSSASISANGTPVSFSGLAVYSHLTVEVYGPFSATFAFQASNDSSNWYPINVTSISNPAAPPSASWTVAGLYYVPVTFAYMQVVVTGYASGTLTFVTEFHAASIAPPTQPVSGTVAVTESGSWNVGISGWASTTLGAPTAYGTVPTGNVIGVNAYLTGVEAVVTAATAPANGLAVLSVNQTTAPSLTAGQSVAQQCDYAGSVFVKPIRRSQTVPQATTIAASTTTTTVLAAQGTGVYADISSFTVTVTMSSSGVLFTATLSDGTNNYIFDLNSLTTNPAQNILHLVFNPSLPATSAATAWTVKLSSATPTVHITVVAVLQKAS